MKAIRAGFSGVPMFGLALEALSKLNKQENILRHQTGPGRKTIDTIHRAIGRSRYAPHQGAKECARRLKNHVGPLYRIRDDNTLEAV